MAGAPSNPIGCPVCAGLIDERTRVICPRCDTPHHSECYSYNGGCALYGCDKGRPATPVDKAVRWLLPTASAGHLSPSRATRAALFWTVALCTFYAISFLHLRQAARPVSGDSAVVREGVTVDVGQPDRTSSAVGSLAPDFALRDLRGQTRSLHEMTRGHVSVLTFWLQRCPDCLEHFPKGARLSSQLEGAGVRMVDVAYRGVPDSTSAWVEEAGITNPVLLDSDGAVVAHYGVGTYTCFVLDPGGTIRYRGPVDGVASVVGELLDDLGR